MISPSKRSSIRRGLNVNCIVRRKLIPFFALGCLIAVAVTVKSSTPLGDAFFISEDFALVETNNTDIPALSEHGFRHDGLLSVNPRGRHPIADLIERSERIWKDKLNRASRTLDEAVAEYQRRYGRAPPKGFDAWWSYARENAVQLPDEYDQINEDLAPLWAVEPAVLRLFQTELEAQKATLTLGKAAGRGGVGLLNHTKSSSNTEQSITDSTERYISLLRPIEDLLPAFRATISLQANPTLLSDATILRFALEAANIDRYLDITGGFPKSLNRGWFSACVRRSPARMHPPNLTEFLPTQTSDVKSFLHDVARAMDPCLHPELLKLSGIFLSSHPGPEPRNKLLPLFSTSKTLLHHDILIPEMDNWSEASSTGSVVVPWKSKTENQLLWRGHNNGIKFTANTKWRQSQRVRLAQMAKDNDGNLRVYDSDDNAAVGVGKLASKKNLHAAYLDVSFVDRPLGCGGPICEELLDDFDFVPPMTAEQEARYKFVMDIDGEGVSGDFKRLLTSGSLVFQATIYRKWYSNRIQPWVHYIPVKMDYSDLYDILSYFHGNLKGKHAHDHLAANIANAGHEWSQKLWRKEDMIAYQFRLLLEYARLLSDDRADMSYYYHP